MPANWRIVPFWNRYAGSMKRPAGLTAAENILDRDFKADRPGQKMVSDITYIPTNEGWLCLAVVMDLLGNKIVGISMDGRMTKEHGFISSMSRKGNCWDNAPMESFWGKLKQEWLNKHHFQTREEATTQAQRAREKSFRYPVKMKKAEKTSKTKNRIESFRLRCLYWR